MLQFLVTFSFVLHRLREYSLPFLQLLLSFFSTLPLLMFIFSLLLYYLRNKKVSARLHVYLRVESTNHQKIGEIIKALQICK